MPTIVSKSVGTKSQYSTGTIAIDATGLIVTLSGGTFDTDWGEGDFFRIDTGGTPETRYVLTRDSATQLTLQTASSKTSQSGLAYYIQRCYTDIDAWDSGEDRNIVSADEIARAVCRYDGQTDSGNISFNYTFSNWTCDSTRYIDIWVHPDSRKTKRSDSGYTLSTTADNCMVIKEVAIVVTGIDFVNVFSSYKNYCVYATDVSIRLEFLECFFKATGHADATGVRLTTTSVTPVLVANCDAFGCNVAMQFGNTATEQARFEIYNSVTNGNGTGVYFEPDAGGGGTMDMYNHYSGDNSSDDYNDGSSGLATLVKCASSDATGSSGLQNMAYSAATGAKFVNVTGGSEDHHIQSGSDLEAAGNNYDTVFTIDIDQETRPSSPTAWDIGIDQISGAPAGVDVHMVGGTQELTGGFTQGY